MTIRELIEALRFTANRCGLDTEVQLWDQGPPECDGSWESVTDVDIVEPGDFGSTEVKTVVRIS